MSHSLIKRPRRRSPIVGVFLIVVLVLYGPRLLTSADLTAATTPTSPTSTTSTAATVATATAAARTVEPARRSTGAPAGAGEHKAGEAMGRILISLVMILVAAKVGGEVVERLGQPAVLGELGFGVLIGNLNLVGFHGFEFMKTNEILAILAEIGVILLLFEVGLESNVKEMAAVGLSSFVVACVGVIAPFFLGWGTAYYFWDQLEALVDPGMRVAMAPYAMYVQIFIGAVLCATSVGITARVLKDLRRVQTAEARIILGAAVIDDVLGLIVLAVCVGMVGAVSGGAEQLSLFNILKIVGISMGFFVAMIGLGPYVLIPLFKYAARLRIRGLLLTLALVVCFFSSWLASWIGLAPIVGAFASGLILEEVHFRYLPEHRERKIEDLIIPLTTFLTPIFFVRMGITVDLGAFGNVAILGFALALSASAILGKQVCAFGVLQRGVDRLAVGLGMIPRGEVGLIFANEGTKLTIGRFPVIDPNVLSAVVIMVMITTVVTPPVLKWRFKQLPVSGPPPVVHEPPSEGPPL